MRSRPWRVVVADDADGLRQLICLLLDLEDDFEVVGSAADGAGAVEIAVAERPDLVVLDLAMPVMDGMAALGELRQRLPDTRVVVCTGYDVAAVGTALTAAGAAAVLQKDSGFTELPGRLRALLAPG
ncbi:MAG: response regulator transcription factor [Mycobacteriales bacterium]